MRHGVVARRVLEALVGVIDSMRLHLLRATVAVITLLLSVAASAAAQTTPLPGSVISNEGVVRAGAQIDSVFISRLASIDTVDVGDFVAHVLARLGVPTFDSSVAGFRVTSDSLRARISGRIADFPPETRRELGPLFSFIDSTALFTAQITMPQHSDGIMRFRLERVAVGAFGIPDILLAVPLADYAARYPVLSANGREFLVEMPADARARFVTNGIEIARPKPRTK